MTPLGESPASGPVLSCYPELRTLDKLIAVSILIVPLLIARSNARIRNPYRGLRRTVSITLAYGVLYVLAIIFLFFRL